MDEEIQWMLSAKAGDQSSFEHILNRYQKPLYNFFYRFFGNEPQAEDATQTLFLQVYQSLPRYQPTAQPRTYLYRCAKNLAINLSRRNSFLSFFSLNDPEHPIFIREPAEKGPEKIFEETEKIRHIQKALLSLPNRQRIAVIYHYYDDCSVAEIAQRMDISPLAVESLLFRARQTLKQKFDPA